MSKWKEVGTWLKDNADSGVGLVGSLLTGNIKGALANGISLVASATGTDDPDKALSALQNNPDSMLKLKELQFNNQDNIRKHVEAMEALKLEDGQKSHHEAQETIRSGDKAEVWYVRAVRPTHATASLIGALYYALFTQTPDIVILSALLTLPFTYMGLRQHSKWMGSMDGAMTAMKKVNTKT